MSTSHTVTPGSGPSTGRPGPGFKFRSSSSKPITLSSVQWLLTHHTSMLCDATEGVPASLGFLVLRFHFLPSQESQHPEPRAGARTLPRALEGDGNEAGARLSAHSPTRPAPATLGSWRPIPALRAKPLRPSKRGLGAPRSPGQGARLLLQESPSLALG